MDPVANSQTFCACVRHLLFSNFDTLLVYLFVKQFHNPNLWNRFTEDLLVKLDRYCSDIPT